MCSGVFCFFLDLNEFAGDGMQSVMILGVLDLFQVKFGAGGGAFFARKELT